MTGRRLSLVGGFGRMASQSRKNYKKLPKCYFMSNFLDFGLRFCYPSLVL